MLAVFDAGMLSILIHPEATIPDDPSTGMPLTQAKERIAYLVNRLEEQRATIIIPTPALAEFLFVVDETGATYLRILHTYASFDIREFDEKAAIECAESQRKAFAKGDKKSGGTGTYQKSKVDRQIISVAKALQADVIYTTDDDVVRMVRTIGGLQVVAVWDLPLPTPDEEQHEQQRIIPGSTADLFGGDDSSTDSPSLPSEPEQQ